MANETIEALKLVRDIERLETDQGLDIPKSFARPGVDIAWLTKSVWRRSRRDVMLWEGNPEADKPLFTSHFKTAAELVLSLMNKATQ